MKGILWICVMCMGLGVFAQKNSKTVVHSYSTVENGAQIRADFPIPFKQITERNKQARVVYVSAKDTLKKMEYILNITVHNAPLGKIEEASLVESVFDSFEAESKAKRIEQKPIKMGAHNGLKGIFADSQRGLFLEYQVYMIGVVQVQQLVVYPYTTLDHPETAVFLGSLNVK